MADSIGGKLALGTENPKPDVIRGWNFKVAGSQTSGIGSQSLELTGLVPFVQLIGIYDQEEIDKLLGKRASLLDRTVEFINEDEMGGAYNFDGNTLQDYAEQTQNQINSFEEKMRDKYVKLFFINKDMRAGEAVGQNGVVLATNAPQAGNEAYEVDAEGVDTPKDSGGVGITDLQVETGTKDFLNRRYKLRMTITDPQTLNDRPEYLKLATLQSKFLIIYGWSNPEILSSWPEDFAPCPVITDVGATIDGEYFPNGRMTVDLNHNNTGGAWSASLVATTMYDFAFNEVGQLEASFTFMPREISFMHTIRMPSIAPVIHRVLGTGDQNEPATLDNPQPAPKPFFGYVAGVGSVIGEFGRNLAQIIAEEQRDYIDSNNALETIFQNMDDGEMVSGVNNILTNWYENVGSWSDQNNSNTNIDTYYQQQRDAYSSNRFPWAGVGLGTLMKENKPPIEGEEEGTVNYKSKINYYYLGWVLEALRFSLWDLNKKKTRRGEMPYDLKFKYMSVPQNSILNYAVQDQITQSIVPSIKNYTAEAMKTLQMHCFPAQTSRQRYDPMAETLDAYDYYQFRAVSVTDFTRSKNVDGAPVNYGPINSLSDYGYSFLDFTRVGGFTGEDEDADRRNRATGLAEWDSFTYDQKIAQIPYGDYRKSLWADGDVIRIMHPDFEYQILYNVIPKFNDSAFGPWEHPNNSNRWEHRLGPRGVVIRSQYGTSYISEKLWKFIDHYESDARGTRGPEVTWKNPDDPENDTETLQTIGYGFWFNRHMSNQFIGEAIFTYSDENKMNEHWKGCMPILQNDDTFDHGRFARQARSAFDGGDFLQKNPGMFGIIMPAQSARLFKKENYERVQQEWYNLHISYLKDNFESKISNRISEIIENNQNVYDVAAEPVDLFWLTGKKYSHSLVQLGRRNDASYGWWQTINYDKDGAGIYSSQEAIEKVGNLSFTSNQIEIDRLNDMVSDIEAEIAGLEGQLTTSGEPAGASADAAETSLYYATDDFYGSTDDFAATDTRLARIQSAEDEYLKTIIGTDDKVKFLNNRMNLLLRELVTKDLIVMENNTIPEDDQSIRYTISSKYFPPENVRNISTQATVGSPWIWYQNAVGNTRQPIPTTVGGNALIVKEYTLVAVNPDIRTMMRRSGEDYADDEVFNISSLEASYGGDASNRQKYAEYVRYWTMPLLENVGAVRYVRIATRGHHFMDNYIGLPGGSFSGGGGGGNPIPLIDSIGHFGSDEEWQRAELGSQNLTTGQFEARLRAGLERGNDSFNNYILMNLCDQNIRDTYTFGQDVMEDIDTGNAGLSRQWAAATEIFDTYLRNCKTLLKSYISRRDLLTAEKNRINSLLDGKRHELRTVTTELNSFAQEFSAANIGETLSPFGESGEFDQTVDVQLGGGRKMTLKGSRAQQIAMRFSKKLMFGEGDIQNYGPPPGGMTYSHHNVQYYGWVDKGPGPDGDGTYGWPWWNGLIAHFELKDFFPANLSFSQTPVQIARPLNRDGNPYAYPSDLPSNQHSGKRNGKLRVTRRGNDVVNDGRRTVWQMSIDGGGLGTHSAGSGIALDIARLKQLFKRKFKKDIAIGEGENEQSIYTKLKGDTIWPTMRKGQALGGEDASVMRESGDSYWCLWVDDDLDFIVPKEWLAPGFPNEGMLDTSPYKWYKLPWRFYPISDSDAEVLYPTASGARIARNEHLPNLPEDAVRQLVRTEINGYSGEPAEAHRLTAPTGGYSSNGTGEGTSMPGSDKQYGGNPRRAYLGDDRAKIRQSSTLLSYFSAGRPAATTEYPYGIPAGMEVPDNLKASDTTYYETVADALKQGTADDPGTTHQQLAADDASLGVDRAAVTSQAEQDVDFNDNYKDTNIMETTPRWSVGSYWPQMPSTDITVVDILRSLPREFEFGFFSSVKNANEDFEGGEELNEGIKEWIYKYLINLLPNGRRIGIHPNNPDSALVGGPDALLDMARKETGRLGDNVRTYQSEVDAATGSNWKIRDVCYGDLFESVESPIKSNMDFGNKTIHNIAEIPIKREVVDNLLNRRNTNMSIMQFVQQLITPSSIGIAGDVQIAGRNKNGVMELAVASVDYRGITDDLFKSSEEAMHGAGGETLPTDQLLFDYKRRNSLIENIDMSSKMDPAAFLTYQNSSSMIHGPGRDFNILKLLSYEGVAEDFKDYLEGIPTTSDAGESYSGIINVGLGNMVTVDRVRYSHLPPSILDGFVSQNPERWAKITAMLQGQNNFTTDLLAFYMRAVTITIHGLTNIEPFNLIHVKGVLPSLEGIYIVTNLTDRITPAGFQTILEGKLLRKEKEGSQQVTN